MNIGIVGAGPSGIIAAMSVIKTVTKEDVAIDFYEPGTPFNGRSLNTLSDKMLLNSSIDITFSDPDEPADFLNYINAFIDTGAVAADFVSREHLSSFLKYKLNKLNAKINIIPEAVIDMIIVDQTVPVIITERSRQKYDAVIISTGLGFKSPPEFFRHKKTVTPYPATIISGLDKNAKVLVLGTKLSAIDAIVHIAGQSHSVCIDVYSPGQLFPSVRHHIVRQKERLFLEEYLGKIKDLPNDYSVLLCMINMVKEYLKKNAMNVTDFIAANGRKGPEQLNHDIMLCRENKNVWENILVDIMDGLNHAYTLVDDEVKRRFNRDVMPWFGRILASMPLRNAETMSDLFKEGRLRLLSTDEVLIEDTDKYDVIVNATGLRPVSQDPLLLKLKEQGILDFNGGGGLSIHPRTHRVHPDLPIYANGAIVQGAVFSAHSIYSSAYGAKKIADDIKLLSVGN